MCEGSPFRSSSAAPAVSSTDYWCTPLLWAFGLFLGVCSLGQCCACVHACTCRQASGGWVGPLALFYKSSTCSSLPSSTQVTPTDFLRKLTQPTAAQSPSPGPENCTGCGTSLQDRISPSSQPRGLRGCQHRHAGPSAVHLAPRDSQPAVVALGVTFSFCSSSCFLGSDSRWLCQGKTRKPGNVTHLTSAVAS